MTYPNARDCEHGQLRRSCNICEYENRIRELEQQLAEAEMYREKVREIIEVLAGLEGFIPETAPEAYLQRALNQVEEIAILDVSK